MFRRLFPGLCSARHGESCPGLEKLRAAISILLAISPKILTPLDKFLPARAAFFWPTRQLPPARLLGLSPSPLAPTSLGRRGCSTGAVLSVRMPDLGLCLVSSPLCRRRDYSTLSSPSDCSTCPLSSLLTLPAPVTSCSTVYLLLLPSSPPCRQGGGRPRADALRRSGSVACASSALSRFFSDRSPIKHEQHLVILQIDLSCTPDPEPW